MTLSGNPVATYAGTSRALLQGQQPTIASTPGPQYATPYSQPSSPAAARPTTYSPVPLQGYPATNPYTAAAQPYANYGPQMPAVQPQQPSVHPSVAAIYHRWSGQPTPGHDAGSANGGGPVEVAGNAIVSLTKSAQGMMDQIQKDIQTLLFHKGELSAQELAFINQQSSQAALRMEEARKMRENQERAERAAVA